MSTTIKPSGTGFEGGLYTKLSDGTYQVLSDANGTLAGQNVLTAQVTLTNAEILALHTTSIAIVPAPGPGLLVVPIQATMAYTFNTSAYATNTELDLTHNGTLVPILKTDISQGDSTFALFANAVSATPPQGSSFVSNAALNLFVPAGNPTGGHAGASIKVTVLYTIMSVL